DEPVDLNEESKVRHAGDGALDDVPDLMALLEGLPIVGLEFLDRKRDPPVLLVDRRDDRLDVVALLQDLRGVLDPLGPGHVRNMDEPVHSLFDLDEGAEVGEIAYLARNAASD